MDRVGLAELRLNERANWLAAAATQTNHLPVEPPAWRKAQERLPLPMRAKHMKNAAAREIKDGKLRATEVGVHLA